MKFKLSEKYNTQCLDERVNPEMELLHIYADLADNSYKASGYLSNLNKKEIDKLKEFCESNDIDIEEVMGWEAHHINGVHPARKNAEHNSYSNVALMTSDVHQHYTYYNRNLVMKLAQNLNYRDDRDIDILIGRLIATCVGKGIAPSSILKPPIKEIRTLIENIMKEAQTYFAQTWESHNSEKIRIIPMSVVMSNQEIFKNNKKKELLKI